MWARTVERLSSTAGPLDSDTWKNQLRAFDDEVHRSEVVRLRQRGARSSCASSAIAVSVSPGRTTYRTVDAGAVGLREDGRASPVAEARQRRRSRESVDARYRGCAGSGRATPSSRRRSGRRRRAGADGRRARAGTAATRRPAMRPLTEHSPRHERPAEGTELARESSDRAHPVTGQPGSTLERAQSLGRHRAGEAVDLCRSTCPSSAAPPGVPRSRDRGRPRRAPRVRRAGRPRRP